jgi:hypothetical protein
MRQDFAWATEYWFAIFTDTRDAPGHAWVAVFDTKQSTTNVAGFYPHGFEAGPDNPSGPGIVRDDAKRRYTQAVAYPIDKGTYQKLNDKLKQLKEQGPIKTGREKYDLYGNNCATWVIDIASFAAHVIFKRDMNPIVNTRAIDAKYDRPVFSPGQLEQDLHDKSKKDQQDKKKVRDKEPEVFSHAFSCRKITQIIAA